MDRKLIHELPVTVTQEMIDMNDHLNNEKAENELRRAQNELLWARLTGWADISFGFEVACVISEKHTWFKKQILLGEQVTIRTTLTTTGVRLCFKQEVMRGQELCILHTFVRTLWHREQKKTIRIPAELLEQLFGASTPRAV